jgi:hypothetical protein
MKQRAAMFEMTKSIQTFLSYRSYFPVDPRHNSKINREKLAAWAAEQLKKSLPEATGGLAGRMK